jgi:hypothetical protein
LRIAVWTGVTRDTRPYDGLFKQLKKALIERALGADGFDDKILSDRAGSFEPQLIAKGRGINHDTAAFAVQTIRRWWQEVGRIRYPETKGLVITADGGGSNGSRLRLWKRDLQHLANEIGIEIAVSHSPRHHQVERSSTVCSL